MVGSETGDAASTSLGTSTAAGTSDDTLGTTTGTSWPGCPEFVDAFEGGLDRAWVHDNDGGGEVASVDGQLRMTVSAPVDTNNKLELEGAWTGAGARVKVELGDTPTEPSVNQMIRFTTDDVDLLAFRVVRQAGDVTVLEVWHAVENLSPNQTIEKSADFDPDAHRWLRVRELSDERLVFETSAYEDTSYELFYQMDDIFDLDGARVGLATNNSSMLADDTEVSFGYFELLCGGG